MTRLIAAAVILGILAGVLRDWVRSLDRAELGEIE